MINPPVKFHEEDSPEEQVRKIRALFEDLYDKLGQVDRNIYDFIADKVVDQPEGNQVPQPLQTPAADGVPAEDNIVTFDTHGMPKDSGVAVSGVAGTHGIDSSTHTGVSGATEDNLVSFDDSGLPKDSGEASSDVHTRLHTVTNTSDHTGVDGATEDNIIVFDGNGLFRDSGWAVDEIVGELVLAGASGSYDIITNMQINSSNMLQKKTRSFTFSDGLLTTVGAESGWTDIGTTTTAIA